MEIEYFVHPDDWQPLFDMWVDQCHKWFDALGLDGNKIHELEVPETDRAHYSKRTIDFEFDFPIGREELMGLAYRTDFDLGNIQRVSSKSMEYRPKDGSPAFVPHVIEPSFGVERALMAVLASAYWNDTENDRVVLKLPYSLAPVKVAVCPLAKNNAELVAKARDIYAKLKAELGAVLWIDSGNIGKNYRKMDEIGVPYVVTVDFDTLEGDTKDTVTVRTRDTLAQERHKTLNLIALLSRA
jgi:glycyl-tRNA synthetase